MTRVVKTNSVRDLVPKKGKNLDTEFERFKCQILNNEHEHKSYKRRISCPSFIIELTIALLLTETRFRSLLFAFL
jgi:hypothetical protein